MNEKLLTVAIGLLFAILYSIVSNWREDKLERRFEKVNERISDLRCEVNRLEKLIPKQGG